VITAKVKGKAPKLVAQDHGPRRAEVVDLMARLRASLAGKKGAGLARRAGSPRRAAASKRGKGKRVA
jgi:non-homologous end joining protein Ku